MPMTMALAEEIIDEELELEMLQADAEAYRRTAEAKAEADRQAAEAEKMAAAARFETKIRKKQTIIQARFLDYINDCFGCTSNPTFDSLMDFVVREEKCKASDFGVQLMTEEKSGRFAKSGVSVQVKRTSAHVDSGVSNIATSSVPPEGPKRFPVSKASNGTPLVAPQCFVCKWNNNVDCNHGVAQCQTFRSMPPFKRRELVFRARHCFNCLGSHLVVDCASNSDCRKCEGSKIGKHFQMLHDSFVSTIPKDIQNAVDKNNVWWRRKAQIVFAERESWFD